VSTDADTLGIPLRILVIKESTALTVEPEPNAAAAYRELYENWLDRSTATRRHWPNPAACARHGARPGPNRKDS
jgi:hypothetical protein